jgi:hypothetical protein
LVSRNSVSREARPLHLIIFLVVMAALNGGIAVKMLAKPTRR